MIKMNKKEDIVFRKKWDKVCKRIRERKTTVSDLLWFYLEAFK